MKLNKLTSGNLEHLTDEGWRTTGWRVFAVRSATGETHTLNVRFKKMKTILQLIFLLGFATLGAGCASTRAYFVDRGRDTADVFTLSVGQGVGAKAKVCTISIGALWQRDLWGLRGGTLGRLHKQEGKSFWSSDPSELDTCEVYMLVGGIDKLNTPSAVAEQRHKHVDTYHYFILLPHTELIQGEFDYSYSLMIDVVVGLGGSIRAGFNPGELLDFILGWTTIDIFDDDLERKKRKSNKPTEGAK